MESVFTASLCGSGLARESDMPGAARGSGECGGMDGRVIRPRAEAMEAFWARKSPCCSMIALRDLVPNVSTISRPVEDALQILDGAVALPLRRVTCPHP
jgi:hypothetical protein